MTADRYPLADLIRSLGRELHSGALRATTSRTC